MKKVKNKNLVFYDHLIDLSDISEKIKKKGLSKEEHDELMTIIDEMIHHRVVGCILDKLPKNYHEEFLGHFSDRPHDENLLTYLKEKAGEDLSEFIKTEVRLLASELHEEIDRKLS
ncbi:MAG: hypothetical protein HY044_01975 [Candidatus Woesebacteria bacterium]|nr:MAG: hypothetical protein HY044_01975 [Candidatus Woesebacteria bacterium]